MPAGPDPSLARGSPDVIVGIDTGGTFTDLVVVDGDEIRLHKLPSTPDDPSRAVLEGLAALLGAERLDEVRLIHGSTVATNALLERKGPTVALVTTAGFEDVIEIGRQARRDIYDLAVTKPEPLVAPGCRIGVDERLDEGGVPVVELEPEEVSRVVEAVAASGARAVAICTLHSYANPEHERRLAAALREAGDAFVTASHEVLAEFREYERTSTTAVNAFVGPVMSRYLGRIGERLGPDRVRIMASNGGVVPLEAAGRLAVQTILSGPAGGAVGGFEVGRLAGHDHVITFDMGGTSTDVSLCAGGLTRTSEAEIDGLPIRVPVIDIHTVGAGGGSVAWRDPGGSLRVGPESAGADPGPICYGRGGERVTVTDANLFLGRLSPDHFLGGESTLDADAVAPRLRAVAEELGLEPAACAEGVVRVANATMERAIRVISLERGFDPREFTLVCFGGAGGLHAADLARALGIPRVLVPEGAGTLSALGMLLADPIRDFSRTIMRPTDALEPGALETEFARLEDRGRRELTGEGLPEASLRFERFAELRYVGQGFELPVSASTSEGVSAAEAELGSAGGTDGGRVGAALASAFHVAHERRFGYADPERPTEIVTVRVRATAITDKPDLRPRDPAERSVEDAILGPHPITYGGETHEGALVGRDRLGPGHELDGPAVVVEYSTTTLVPPGARCRVDERGNLVLEWRTEGRTAPDSGAAGP